MMNQVLVVICVVLLVLCMAVPLKKTGITRKYPWIQRILSLHIWFGWLLVMFGCWHGIVSGKAPAMISGKLAWMVLLGFMVVSTVQSKIGKKCMPKVHGGVSLLVIGLVALHAIHGLMT